MAIRPHRELREIDGAQDQLNFRHDSSQNIGNSKRLHSRRSSHEFRHRPHDAPHFFVLSLSVSLNSSGTQHSAPKPMLQAATVNSATLDVDLKYPPRDFRRSWYALTFFFPIPAE